MKAVVTLSIVVVIAIISFLLAKLFRLCRKKHIIANDDDDKSGFDDSTKNILRARLSVLQFKKAQLNKTRQSKTLENAKKWISKFRERKTQSKDDKKSEEPLRNGGTQVTVDIEKGDNSVDKTLTPKIDKNKQNNVNGVNVHTNGISTVTETVSQKVTRSSFFSPRNKVAGSPPVLPDITHLPSIETRNGDLTSNGKLVTKFSRENSAMNTDLNGFTVRETSSLKKNGISNGHSKSVHFEKSTESSRLKSSLRRPKT